jgi:hypothetical protein
MGVPTDGSITDGSVYRWECLPMRVQMEVLTNGSCPVLLSSEVEVYVLIMLHNCQSPPSPLSPSSNNNQITKRCLASTHTPCPLETEPDCWNCAETPQLQINPSSCFIKPVAYHNWFALPLRDVWARKSWGIQHSIGFKVMDISVSVRSVCLTEVQTGDLMFIIFVIAKRIKMRATSIFLQGHRICMATVS